MTEQEYKAMLEEADSLIGRELDDTEIERLLKLGIAIEKYEDEHFPIEE